MGEQVKGRLGIVAGGGRVPQLLVQACRDQHRPYTVVGLSEHADGLSDEPSKWIKIGQAGQCFQAFKQDKVSSVVMAGKVQRPSLLELRPDWRTFKFLLRAGLKAFTSKTAVGDDALLRQVIKEIEREGFSVVSVESVLAALVAKLGTVGRVQPTVDDQKTIAMGVQAAKELGRMDLGQAVVVQNGCVIGREGPDGTDALIRSSVREQMSTGKPILVKTCKPQQDRRADLPVIGPDTVTACIAAGFGGLAVEAEGALIVDQPTVAAMADRGGLFVCAVDGGEISVSEGAK